MENRKKIMYLVTIPDWGGAQNYIYGSAVSASRDGLEVLVFSGQSENYVSKINLLEKLASLKDKSISLGQLKHLTRTINPLNDFLALIEIIKLYNFLKPDLVNLNSSKAGILGSIAKLFSKHKPEIHYVVHGWVFMEPMPTWKKNLYVFLEKIASRFRNKIIVLGAKEKQIALNNRICPEEKLEIRRHFLEAGAFMDKNFSLAQLNLPQDKKIIGTIANFYPVKGLNYLIEAAAKINNSNIIFGVIGDGPERKNYETLIADYGLKEKVILLGEKDCAAQYLKAFDLFVLPSVKEGAPFAILEAMEAGLPIIATEVGNVPEMMKDYSNKIIIPPANINSLAEAIASHI